MFQRPPLMEHLMHPPDGTAGHTASRADPPLHDRSGLPGIDHPLRRDRPTPGSSAPVDDHLAPGFFMLRQQRVRLHRMVALKLAR
jgi:hypothetical protein